MWFRCEHLLTSSGWRSACFLKVGPGGRIDAITETLQLGVEYRSLEGLVVPGMPNVHSHAFQRVMAGSAERRFGGAQDSFWTWREKMYGIASLISPSDLEVIAAQLYVEMLEAGYTAVGEFHYLHHQPGGGRYDAIEEMSLAICRAASSTGIGLCHLPVLYLHGGFGRAAAAEQARFVCRDVDEYGALVEAMASAFGRESPHRLGVVAHSLRAVDPEALAFLLAQVRRPGMPFHVHIAEQPAEVRECEAALGARPVRWLLQTHPMDALCCLIHATHLDVAECEALASSPAAVGLCPTTEANLGDGIFPAEQYFAEGGRAAIGSDSHISVDPAEELRLLEYGQRLSKGRRGVLAGSLYSQLAQDGAGVLGFESGRVEVGCRADLVVLDNRHPRLVGHSLDGALDAYVYGAGREAVRDVFVEGRHVVCEGRHRGAEPIAAAYRSVAGRLLQAV